MHKTQLVYDPPELMDSTHSGGELINSKRFAFLMLLGADVMLFAGLDGGYFVLRGGSLSWPPPGSPALHAALVACSIPLMLLAAIAMKFATKFEAKSESQKLQRSLQAVLVFGVAFLLLNGYEWYLLLKDGLDIMTVFGGIYLILMGTFMVHIIAGLLYSVKTLFRVRGLVNLVVPTNGIQHLAFFFYLQTLVWISLYALIYV